MLETERYGIARRCPKCKFATKRGNIHQINKLQIAHEYRFNFRESSGGGMFNLLFLPEVSLSLDGILYVSLNNKPLKLTLAKR